MNHLKNPTAFPATHKSFETGIGITVSRPGMTLLDYFAGQVLAGGIADNLRFPPNLTDEVLGGVSIRCYDIAEAMLAEREKRIK